LAGNLLSVWPDTGQYIFLRLGNLPGIITMQSVFVNICLCVYGLFSGMFVGCFALSIAEMLDSIPIFTRRISFQKGIGAAICSVSAGKLCGALFYFIHGDLFGN